jgi:hypothetical protein
MQKPTRTLKVYLMIKGVPEDLIKQTIIDNWNLYQFLIKECNMKCSFESFVFHLDTFKIFKNKK